MYGVFRGVLGVCIWCVYDVYTCITGVQGCKYSDEGVKRCNDKGCIL